METLEDVLNMSKYVILYRILIYDNFIMIIKP